MNCIYTPKQRPFCWGKSWGKRGFCAFLQTPNIVDSRIKNMPIVYFTCKLENEKMFSHNCAKLCENYTIGLDKAREVLSKLRSKIKAV